MHRIWNIDELLAFIIQGLVSIKDRAYMARTCRNFYELAMDILWQDIRDINILWHCFPPHIWRKDHLGRIRFVQPPQAEDWAQLLRNGARVKSFTCCFFLDAEEVFQMLKYTYPGAHVLPNVRSLQIVLDPGIAQFAPWFMGPRLVHLSLPEPLLPLAKDTLSRLLDDVPTTLKTLDISSFSIASKAMGSSYDVDVLSKITHLVELDIRIYPHADVLFFVASLPKLRNLRLLVLKGGMHITVPQDDAPTFQSLESLEVLSPVLLSDPTMLSPPVSPRWLPRLLKLIPNHRLRSLVVGYPFSSPDAILPLALALHMQRRLRKLEIHPTAKYRKSTLVPEDLIAAFDALMTLKEIRFFVVPGYVGYYATNDTLSRLSQSWPNLEELDLGPQAIYSNPQEPTLVGLHALAHGCPSLRKVAICVYLSTSQDFPCSSQCLSSDRGGILFNVKKWQINGNWELLANFLERVFPGTNITIESAERTTEADGWNMIISKIPRMKVRRKELSSANFLEDDISYNISPKYALFADISF
ncbi:hypothetical protein K474DRAFT_1768901 [Panus rudis PR-1116 ss-1]|nr:hypothetical protein K474DRAFT_1768901 [Panus rudis PR-1116 ss-1]